jgi:hypothetical protein
MRRVIVSIVIAVAILTVPFVYVFVLPDVKPCLHGLDCKSALISGTGMILLPGLLLVLPLLDSVNGEPIFTITVFLANFVVYSVIVWLLLQRRDRRLAARHSPTLPF